MIIAAGGMYAKPGDSYTYPGFAIKMYYYELNMSTYYQGNEKIYEHVCHPVVVFFRAICYKNGWRTIG